MPDPPRPPDGAPNILMVLFDDVGFSDFGCYGGDAATPTIDRLSTTDSPNGSRRTPQEIDRAAEGATQLARD